MPADGSVDGMVCSIAAVAADAAVIVRIQEWWFILSGCVWWIPKITFLKNVFVRYTRIL